MPDRYTPTSKGGRKVFDSLKRFFNRSSKEEQKVHQMELIDEEIDEFEREIQEYIGYTNEGSVPSSPPSVQQPPDLSKGGAVGDSSLITPEAEKRIKST